MTFAEFINTLSKALRERAVERAAIREFDAGMTRSEAERLTMEEMNR